MISRVRCEFLNNMSSSNIGNSNSPSDKSVLEPLADPKKFHKQVSIDPEPDSLDSVLSNPHSYPITIIPNRPTTYYGLTMHNGKPFTRQASCR